MIHIDTLGDKHYNKLYLHLYRTEKTVLKQSDLNLLRLLVQLEKNVGALYLRFGTLFPEDHSFWKQLSFEEDNHASLIETLKEYILASEDLSKRFLESSEETLLAINAKIDKMLAHPKCGATSRVDALSIALQLEQSAGEMHFQNVAGENNSSVPFQVFNQLSTADRDHYKKILAYMERLK